LTVFFDINQHVAQCANLYFFVPTAIAALVVHIKRHAVDFKTALPIICFGLAGAAGGAYLAAALSTGILRKVFGIFLALMGLYQFFGGKKRAGGRQDEHKF